jgi:hypothetical protein
MLLVFLGFSQGVKAEVPEYILPGNLVVQGDRCFLLKINQNDATLSSYSFPDLVLIENITLPDVNTWATLNKEGIVTYSSTFQDSQKDEILDGKKKVFIVTQVTNHLSTYDLNLNFKSNLDVVSEYKNELVDFSSKFVDSSPKSKGKKKKSSKLKFEKLTSGKLRLLQ